LFLPIWLVSYLLSNMVFSAVSGTQFRPMWASVAELAIFPKITLAVLQELFYSKITGFEVTTKGQSVKERTFHWKVMRVQLFFLIGSLLSASIILVQVIQHPLEQLGYWALPLFWLFYNICSLFGALHISIDRPRYKEQLIAYHCDGVLAGEKGEIPVEILKIHSQKAVLSIAEEYHDLFGEEKEWRLTTDKLANLPVRVLRTFDLSDKKLVSLQMEELDKRNYVALYKILDKRNTESFKKRKF